MVCADATEALKRRDDTFILTGTGGDLVLSGWSLADFRTCGISRRSCPHHTSRWPRAVLYTYAMPCYDCEAKARCSLNRWHTSRGGPGQYGPRCTRFNLSRMSHALHSAVVCPRYRRIWRVDPKGGYGEKLVFLIGRSAPVASSWRWCAGIVPHAAGSPPPAHVCLGPDCLRSLSDFFRGHGVQSSSWLVQTVVGSPATDTER